MITKDNMSRCLCKLFQIVPKSPVSKTGSHQNRQCERPLQAPFFTYFLVVLIFFTSIISWLPIFKHGRGRDGKGREGKGREDCRGKEWGVASPQESKHSEETKTDDLYTVNIIYCNISYNYVTCNCTRTITLQLWCDN